MHTLVINAVCHPSVTVCSGVTRGPASTASQGGGPHVSVNKYLCRGARGIRLTRLVKLGRVKCPTTTYSPYFCGPISQQYSSVYVYIQLMYSYTSPTYTIAVKSSLSATSAYTTMYNVLCTTSCYAPTENGLKNK